MTSANDGQGSGVESIQYMVAGASSWTSTTSDSLTLAFAEGTHELIVRAVDRVGNIGANQTIEINVDETDPVPLGWTVDELTTSRIGPANVSFNAEDLGSGMDNVSSYIQYGFDWVMENTNENIRDIYFTTDASNNSKFNYAKDTTIYNDIYYLITFQFSYKNSIDEEVDFFYS